MPICQNSTNNQCEFVTQQLLAAKLTYDEGYGIITLSNHSAVVTGNFTDQAIFGEDEPYETVLTSVGSYDTFIARYNSDGSFLWAKRASGSMLFMGGDRGRAATTLSDDSTFVTKFFRDTAQGKGGYLPLEG